VSKKLHLSQYLSTSSYNGIMPHTCSWRNLIATRSCCSLLDTGSTHWPGRTRFAVSLRLPCHRGVFSTSGRAHNSQPRYLQVAFVIAIVQSVAMFNFSSMVLYRGSNVTCLNEDGSSKSKDLPLLLTNIANSTDTLPVMENLNQM